MHPYQRQPDRAFLRRAVSDLGWRELDLVGTPKFRLTPEARVATAGSRFAQHIARHLRLRGMPPVLVEQPHPLEQAAGRDGADYQTFSACFGNLYSSREALELAEQAPGVRGQIDNFAEDEGRVCDLLRPNAVKGGFDTVAHARADRAYPRVAIGGVPAASPVAAPAAVVPDLARALQTECEERFNDRPAG